MKKLLLLLSLALPIFCQNRSAYTWIDAYALRPTACTDGTLGYATDQPAGQNLYTCKSNTWTQVGIGLNGNVTGSGTSVSGNLVVTSNTTTTAIGPTTIPATSVALTSQLPLSGTTTAIGGSALTASCSSGTVTVTGATTSMVAVASPSADITSANATAFSVIARVSAANTVTVQVCGTGTPTSVTYLVRVIQ